jgi:hypothetical protein
VWLRPLSVLRDNDSYTTDLAVPNTVPRSRDREPCLPTGGIGSLLGPELGLLLSSSTYLHGLTKRMFLQVWINDPASVERGINNIFLISQQLRFRRTGAFRVLTRRQDCWLAYV